MQCWKSYCNAFLWVHIYSQIQIAADASSQVFAHCIITLFILLLLLACSTLAANDSDNMGIATYKTVKFSCLLCENSMQQNCNGWSMILVARFWHATHFRTYIQRSYNIHYSCILLPTHYIKLKFFWLQDESNVVTLNWNQS